MPRTDQFYIVFFGLCASCHDAFLPCSILSPAALPGWPQWICRRQSLVVFVVILPGTFLHVSGNWLVCRHKSARCFLASGHGGHGEVLESRARGSFSGFWSPRVQWLVSDTCLYSATTSQEMNFMKGFVFCWDWWLIDAEFLLQGWTSTCVEAPALNEQASYLGFCTSGFLNWQSLSKLEFAEVYLVLRPGTCLVWGTLSAWQCLTVNLRPELVVSI